MTGFATITSVAAPLPDADIDTDVIFPARFLLLLDKAGLGKHAFHDRRYDRSGAPRPDFVLNRSPFDRAQILVAGPRFGSGSSREHAVWTLADFGIRCIVATSFGEIFFSNCFKNGVLPIRLGEAAHAALMAAAEGGAKVTVDLGAQSLSWAGRQESFEIEAYRRHALMAGLDEVGIALAEDEEDIRRFETRHRATAPWLFLDDRTQRFVNENYDER